MQCYNATRIALISFLILMITIAEGTSLKTTVPLEGIESVAVSISIGGPLNLEGGVALRLFHGDVERARSFERTLMVEICDLLERYGVTVGSSNSAEILVDIFGRAIENPDEDHHYIFFLRISSPSRSQPGSEIDQDLIPRTVLDISTDVDLERTLTEAALFIIKTNLEDAGRKRSG